MNDQLSLIDGLSPDPNTKPFKRSTRHLRAIRQFSLMQGLAVQLSPHPIYIYSWTKKQGKRKSTTSTISLLSMISGEKNYRRIVSVTEVGGRNEYS
jgi:hypothetical protein